MAHQISWYMGRRIVYALIQGSYLSLADVKALNDELLTFIRQSDSPDVHVIIDASFVKTFQKRLPLQAFTYSREQEFAWTVMIAPASVASQFRPLFARSARVDDFTSLEEGMFFLEDMDTSLLASV